MALDEVREPDLQLVADELSCWYLEDLCGQMSAQLKRKVGPAMVLTVHLFQRELLGLSDEAEHHDPGDEVEPSVESD